MTRRRRILKSGDENPGDHRGDFETCAHCSAKLKHRRWIALGHTLALEPRMFRQGCASITSECPECFESSWIHVDLDSIARNRVLQSWKDAACKESARQKLHASRDWDQSLCQRCCKLESVRVGHSAYRTCKIGIGPAQASCDAFKAVTEPDDPTQA